MLLCNPAAQARGIHPGLSLAAARALAQDLIVRPRDLKAEDQALHDLAAWAYQFSAQVSLYPPYELLLEVQGSFRLFGGYAALADKLQTGLADLGYQTGFATAPTPLSALSLARCNCEQMIDTSTQLLAALAPLPVSVLDWEQTLLDRLDGMGIRRLGELLRLPRDGLARRFGPQALLYLDRMLGRSPHPQRLYQPPQEFVRCLPLPADVERAPALLFALQRLLLEMCGWLQGQGTAVQRVDIRLLHHDQETSHFSLGVYQPTRDAEQLTALLRERIERLELQSPVCSVELRAGEAVRHDARPGDLFDRSDHAGRADLLDHLRARLGDSAVTGLSSVAEHRPEYAWRYRESPPQALLGRPHSSPSTLGHTALDGSTANSNNPQRPLWLLPVPRKLQTRQGHPQLQGPLQLQSGCERIESGWWDEQDLARDYYIATNPAGSSYWIYRELTGERDWYLQGVFE